MTITSGAPRYTQGSGTEPKNNIILFTAAPGPTQVNYPLGQLGIVQASNATYQLTSFSTTNGVTSATWTLLGAGSGDLNTLTTDDSTVVTPTSGNINLKGVGSTTTIGSGSNATVELTGLTNHAVLVGAGTTTITKVGPGTTGFPLVAQGASADPIFTVLGVAGGGTGAATLTAHGVLVGEGTGPISPVTGSTGQVLVGVTGADPSFTGSPSVSGSLTAGTTLTATLGAITATNGNLVLGTAGNKILSTSVGSGTSAGANSFGTVTLSSGTATVSTTAVTASSLVITWRQGVGASTALGEISLGTVVANTSFVVYAATQGTPATPLAADASVIGYMIIN